MTRCADDILAFVENSRHTHSVAIPPQENNPSTLFDAVSERSIADADTLSINWNGRTCYLGFTLPFQLFEALVRRPKRKDDLLKKLTDAEQKHDFYSRLYKQYTVDLLRLAIYARSLLTNSRIREYLDQHHPETVARFEAIIADARG